MSHHRKMAEAKLTWALVDQTAAALGATEDARRQWRKTGRTVPPAWRIKITEHLHAKKMSVSFAAFDALPQAPGRIAA